MKRILALILALAALVSLISCAASLAEEPKTETETTEGKKTATETAAPDGTTHDPTGFSVGFGRVKVTPPAGIGLGGFGNTDSRLSKTVLDDLYVTCVAISDGAQKVLLYSVDFIGVSEQNYHQVAKLVEKALGIPGKNIFITATHTHSGPQIRDGAESVTRYMPVFYKGMTTAAKDAVADLDRAETYIGEALTENLNYVRRYYREDGTFHGPNFISASTSPVIRHETEADGQMQVIRFDRANQKDVVLVNWQCHATTTSGLNKTDVSADFIGPFRDAAEKENDVFFAYYQGAAGNLAPSSSVDSEPDNGDYKAHGKALAAVLSRTLDSMEKTETGAIVTAEKKVFASANADTEGKDVALAQKIVDTWQTGGVETANRLCLEHGFHSYYHARALVGRSKRTATDGKEIWAGAISIGPIAFVGAPYEMFDQNGVQIKTQSPFDMTFICAYTNGAHGYIPTRDAFAAGGYEVDACFFSAGTGEAMVSEYLGMLEELKKEENK